MSNRGSVYPLRPLLPFVREIFQPERGMRPRGGLRLAALLAGSVTSLLLAGCGVGLQSPAFSGPVQGAVISGHVHGGAYPIQQAEITLMETQNNGYGGQGKVLEQVKSDTYGSFTFDNKWTCDAGQYTYIVTTGGHSGPGNLGNNTAIMQLGVIGSCASTIANSAKIDVYLSEPGTVAAAYALNNFISIYTDTTYGVLAGISAPANNNAAASSCTGVGTAMTCTAAGIAHGFANALNLVDTIHSDGTNATGLALSSIPGNSQSVVPQAMINTLANIIQDCIDSASNTSSYCSTLFQNATPPGGKAPTNVLQAMQNIASYPNNNVDALFQLQTRTSFFTPALSTDYVSNTNKTLISYSISIFYEGTGLTGDPGFGTPVHVALDAGDNAYIVYSGYDTAKQANYSAIDGLSPGGTGLFAGSRIYNLTNPNEVALDNLGYAWVTDDSVSGLLYQVPTSGANAGTLKTSYAVTNGYPGGVALDESNDVWISRDAADGNQSIYEYVQGNSYASADLGICTQHRRRPETCTYPTLNAANKRLFIDSKQNVFGVTVGTSSDATFYVYANSLGNQATLATTPLSTSGGFGIAMTSADEAYLPLNGSLNSANATDVQNQDGTYTINFSTNANSNGIYTGTSQTGSVFTNPGDVVIDGSGNIHWTDFESSGQLFKMVPGSDGTITKGTLTSVYPCFPLNNQCYGTSSNLRGMAVDSSGAIWYVAVTSPGIVIQTLGFAANSWPLLSFAHAGSVVQ